MVVASKANTPILYDNKHFSRSDLRNTTLRVTKHVYAHTSTINMAYFNDLAGSIEQYSELPINQVKGSSSTFCLVNPYNVLRRVRTFLETHLLYLVNKNKSAVARRFELFNYVSFQENDFLSYIVVFSFRRLIKIFDYWLITEQYEITKKVIMIRNFLYDLRTRIDLDNIFSYC